MGRVGHKKMKHSSIRDNQRKFRTRARVKDLDEIHALLQNPVTPSDTAELPGMGQFYCSECDRYFISMEPLEKHIKSKVHKRRIKELKAGVYTQKDAEAAVGLTTDNGIRRGYAEMAM